jgi:predicted metal-dependent hydrolase
MAVLKPQPLQIKLGDIPIEVTRKAIKNIYLRIHRPTGEVRISAPKRMSTAAIRRFALSKLEWIERHQATLRREEREIPVESFDHNSRYVWGKRHLLTVIEHQAPPSIELDASPVQGIPRMLLRVRPRTAEHKQRALVDGWYRQQMKTAVPPLLACWEPRLGVKVKRFYLRQMTSLWGSCNYRVQTIRLNTELAKQPPKYLEYIVVHELAHLLEPSHNARFYRLMDGYMPGWKAHRRELNRLPMCRQKWG